MFSCEKHGRQHVGQLFTSEYCRKCDEATVSDSSDSTPEFQFDRAWGCLVGDLTVKIRQADTRVWVKYKDKNNDVFEVYNAARSDNDKFWRLVQKVSDLIWFECKDMQQQYAKELEVCVDASRKASLPHGP